MCASIAWLNTEKQDCEDEAGASYMEGERGRKRRTLPPKKRGRIFTTARYHPGFFIVGRLET